jgi:hypothetical protein
MASPTENTTPATPATLTQEERTKRTRALENLQATVTPPLPTAIKAAGGDKDMAARQKDILSHYKFPAGIKTMADADAALVPIVLATARAEAELTLTAIARLASALSPVLVLLLKDQPGSPAIKPDVSLLGKVKAHIRNIPALAESVTSNIVRIENGTQVQTKVPRVPVWAGVDENTYGVAIKAAALLAWSHKTGVCLGYYSGQKMPVPGDLPYIGWNTKAEGAKFTGICAPHNLLRPICFNGTAMKMNADKTFNGALPMKNTDKELRALSWSLINELFRIHYDGGKPAYETTSTEAGMPPSGYMKPNRVVKRREGGSGTGAGDLASLDAMVANLQATDPLAVLAGVAVVLSKRASEWKTKDNRQFVGAVCNLATLAIRQARKEGWLSRKDFCDGKGAAAMVALHDEICNAISGDQAGERFTTDTEGRNLLKITCDDPVVLAGTVPPNSTSAAA